MKNYDITLAISYLNMANDSCITAITKDMSHNDLIAIIDNALENIDNAKSALRLVLSYLVRK
jgi:predicted DNA-binding ribbon-helix-helix protein